ncbi:MAG: hypothetical protein ACNS61_06400 [Candidatus Wenzhouxiangella sp. M2_3B_020]
MNGSIKNVLSCVVLAAPIAVFSASASAEYEFQIFTPPASSGGNGFGISENGMAVGNTDDGGFIYDRKKDTYTTISEDFGAIGISNNGTVVGSDGVECAIRSRNGDITFFTPPTATPLVLCQIRGVNSNGMFTGFIVDETSTWSGFTYDPEYDMYEEFLQSPVTFAHGINEQGQVVGSQVLFPGEAYPGSGFGHFGFLRQAGGAVSYFEVTQAFDGTTRGRGISETGLVTGWYFDRESVINGNPFAKSFVTILAGGPGFESIVLDENEILHQSPCDESRPSPGPGYELTTDVFASHITEQGVVAGSCTDNYFNAATGDFIQYLSGFIATPVD